MYNRKQTSMKNILFLPLCILTIGLYAQQPASAAASRATLLKANESILLYPFIKGSTNTGVMPVEDPTFTYSYKGSVKLVYDLTQGTAEPAKGELNPGLEEIVRQLNLHVAAGVEPKRMEIAIVIHSAAAQALTDNALYRQKYQIDNPNLPLIRQLQEKKNDLYRLWPDHGIPELKDHRFPRRIQKSLFRKVLPFRLTEQRFRYVFH